ncbi:MAG TPA: glycosyltransferase [Oleiagrimonas sp.]|nr:glycosyltransferase [Oleiagrimonas sp.]
MLMLALAALALWTLVIVLPWRPWGCIERLEVDRAGAESVDDVTVLIPARDEAAVIGKTLRALSASNPDLPVIVVDDQSGDGTVDVARAAGLHKLAVVSGTSPPAGWSGKLWALQQGLERVSTPWVLLLDADIRLAPGMVSVLRRKAGQGFSLVSLCAEPCWNGVAARWLLPAFVYFFKLLYPFALANRDGSSVAAAAGGVVLVDRRVLLACGGFSAWRDAIIDDCTLAAHVKRAGHACYLGLTRGAASLRSTDMGGIVHMVARTAFVQLRESWWLLLGVSTVMALAFWVPVVAVCVGGASVRSLGILAWLAMAACHVPILRYYRRNLLAALVLPLTATLFLAMTWYSAWRALGGVRSEWKGRRYRRDAGRSPDQSGS